MKRATLTPEELKAVTEKFLRVGLALNLKQELDHSLWLETGGEPIELDKDLVALAIDLATAKLSDRLAAEFAREFAKQLRGIVEKDHRGKGAKKDRGVAGGDPNGKQQTSEAPPRTAEEVHDYLEGYCTKNLGGFNFSDKALADHAENVAKKAKAIKEDLELEDRHIDALAQIALYDIFFLCDDSGSMKIGKRIGTLTKTLQSVADWATRLEPRGISVRFLNFKGDTDQHFDGLVDIPTIQDRLYKVKFGGGTMLGTMLDEKIITPFILRMERLENKRPLIAVIITDGEPTGEDEFCLKDTIISCKNHPQLAELGTGSILFILFRVGTSDEAKDFLGNLAADEDVKGMLYSAGDDIQEVRDAFERRLNVGAKTKENMYKKFLLEEFMNALQMQTD